LILPHSANPLREDFAPPRNEHEVIGQDAIQHGYIMGQHCCSIFRIQGRDDHFAMLCGRIDRKGV
jgi:hypothetical protein